jgi:uridine kinase
MLVTENLIDIIHAIERKRVRFIVVDGIDGSGKSTLAKEISDKLGIIHINLDDYLNKNHGGFADFIDYSSLQDLIEQTNISIIIEGVCALAVVKKLGINPGPEKLGEAVQG